MAPASAVLKGDDHDPPPVELTANRKPARRLSPRTQGVISHLALPSSPDRSVHPPSPVTVLLPDPYTPHRMIAARAPARHFHYSWVGRWGEPQRPATLTPMPERSRCPRTSITRPHAALAHHLRASCPRSQSSVNVLPYPSVAVDSHCPQHRLLRHRCLGGASAGPVERIMRIAGHLYMWYGYKPDCGVMSLSEQYERVDARRMTARHKSRTTRGTIRACNYSGGNGEEKDGNEGKVSAGACANNWEARKFERPRTRRMVGELGCMHRCHGGARVWKA